MTPYRMYMQKVAIDQRLATRIAGALNREIGHLAARDVKPHQLSGWRRILFTLDGQAWRNPKKLPRSSVWTPHLAMTKKPEKLLALARHGRRAGHSEVGNSPIYERVVRQRDLERAHLGVLKLLPSGRGFLPLRPESDFRAARALQDFGIRVTANTYT